MGGGCHACVAVPLFVSVIIYILDVVLDISLGIRHFKRHDPWWGYMTFTFVLLSWLFTLGRALWELIASKEDRKEKTFALIAAGKYF